MLSAKAYAKINLGLQIVRKREDGYHDLDTVFHRIGIHDELTFTKRERGIGMQCTDASLPLDETNLCHKAAIRLFSHCGYDGGVHIELAKQIPYGAGLGGGSSDAATTLLALNHMFDLNVDEESLARIGSSLGADVPYFLQQGSAHALGTGNILQYFKLSIPYWIVLIAPPVHVSTPWAYSQFKFNPMLPIVPLKQLIIEHIGEPAVLVNNVRNDFEPVVFEQYEEIMRIKEILYRTGASFALMSGSGSSVFGFFDREDYAAESAEFFKRTYSVFLTPPHFSPAE